MHTSWNLFEAESLHIESAEHRFVVSPVTLVDIHALPNDYRMNGLPEVRTERHVESQPSPMNNARQYRHIVRSTLQN